MIARRALLKLIGATPIAAPVAIKEALASAALAKGALGGVGGVGPSFLSGGSATYGIKEDSETLISDYHGSGLTKVLWQKLAEARDEAQNDENARDRMRFGGIDLDLVVLKSTSPAYKMVKMNERYRDHRNLIRQAEKILNW